MKKFIVAILSLLYVTVSSGASIHLHYCMDKLVNWSWTHERSENCSKCGMEDTSLRDNCCKDEFKQVKLQEDQKVTEAAVSLMLWTATASLCSPLYSCGLVKLPAIAQEYPVSHAPPAGPDQGIYLRNRNFRI